VALWLAVYGVALLTGHWHSAVPEDELARFLRLLRI
jgi:hypothetical protein